LAIWVRVGPMVAISLSTFFLGSSGVTAVILFT
jgi:hypothetical protein